MAAGPVMTRWNAEACSHGYLWTSPCPRCDGHTAALRQAQDERSDRLETEVIIAVLLVTWLAVVAALLIGLR